MLAAGLAAPGAPAAAEPDDAVQLAAPDTRATPWRLVLDDDFDGEQLDGTLWSRYSGDTGMRDRDNVEVHDGMATLRSVYDEGRGAWTHAGLCACRQDWQDQTYGKYEFRTRVSASDHRVAALLWPDEGWPPEIDIMEMGGRGAQGARQLPTQTLHYGPDNRMVHSSVAADMTQWHTVGAEWGPGWVRYSLDGVPHRTLALREVPAQPMHLVFQTAIERNGTQTTPTTWDIDRVRVWAYEGGAATAPDAPTGVRVTAVDGGAEVSWDRPADGGSALSGYTVTEERTGQTRTVTGPVEPPTSVLFRGLRPGDEHVFTVTATNAYGSSGDTPSRPGAPTGELPVVLAPQVRLPWQAELGADGSVPLLVTWGAEAGSPAVCGYRAQRATSGGDDWADLPLARPAAERVRDVLVPGRPQQYRVTGTDCAGAAGAPAVGPVVRSTLHAPADAQVQATGAWQRDAAGARTDEDGALLAFRVEGARQAVLFADRGPGLGRARVLVDGRFAGAVDTRDDEVAPRRVALTVDLPDDGPHTVEVVAVVRPGASGLAVSGLLTLGE